MVKRIKNMNHSLHHTEIYRNLPLWQQTTSRHEDLDDKWFLTRWLPGIKSVWLITISIEWMSFLYGSTSVLVYLGVWLQRVKDYGYQTCFVQTEYQIAWWGWCYVCESLSPQNTSRNKVKAWEGQTVGLMNTFNWFFFQHSQFFLKWSRLFIQHVWLCWYSDIELEGDIWDADLRCYVMLANQISMCEKVKITECFCVFEEHRGCDTVY